MFRNFLKLLKKHMLSEDIKVKAPYLIKRSGFLTFRRIDIFHVGEGVLPKKHLIGFITRKPLGTEFRIILLNDGFDIGIYNSSRLDTLQGLCIDVCDSHRFGTTHMFDYFRQKVVL